MDLVPKPDQVVAAAANVAHTLLYGGLADLRPMPRTLIDDGVLREVYHYRPAPEVAPTGDPVLLVTPLAAPALCYDLRRGCSLAEHLVTQGRPTYLVEYGEVSFKDRSLGLEHWVDEVLPAAVRAVSEHAGGRPVHLVGWSLGGIFALLTAADQPALPIASLTVLGTPVDVKQVPLVAPLRPLLDLELGQGLVTRAYRALGGVPKPLVGWAFQLASVQKLVTKPLAIVTHLDDAEYLAQLEAVDRFASRMIAYPGRSFGQLYHRFVRGNALVRGSIELGSSGGGDRTIALSSITVPVLVFAGATDGIAPMPSVQAMLPLLSGSRETAFEIVPGGHLGLLTGRAARTSTWPVIDAWVDRWTTPGVVPAAKKKAAPRKRAAGKKAAPAKKATPPKKVAAAKTAEPEKKAAPAKTAEPEKKAAPAKTAEPEIGTNPQRRYGSGSSRSLGR